MKIRRHPAAWSILIHMGLFTHRARPPQSAQPTSQHLNLQLQRVLASDCFKKTKRLSELLAYLAAHSLSNSSGSGPLKEYDIGVNVYGRGADFDPRVDSIVRVEATRLRNKLREYYESEGRADTIRIELPRGSYMPVFRGLAPPASQPGSRRRRRLGIAFAVLALTTVVLTLVIRPGIVQKTAPGHSVAVLGFRNLSEQNKAAWLSTALSEMTSTELTQPQFLRVIPPDRIERLKSDLSISDAGLGAAQSIDHLAANLAADYIVIGTYTTIGEAASQQIRVDVAIRDGHSGQTLARLADSAPESELFMLATRLGARLRQTIAPGSTAVSALSAWPAKPEAMRLYSEGLDRFRHSDPLAARDLFERAVAADPSNALAHSLLAQVLSALGYDARARQEAKRSFDLSSQLSRPVQLDIESRYRLLTHDWDRAVSIYRNLFELSPDNLEQGLLLAEAQWMAVKNKDALTTIATLRKLPKPQSEDPRLDLLEARAYGDLSDFESTRLYAGRSADKAQKQGAKFLQAQSLLLESGAMLNLGISSNVEKREEARRLCEQIGDRFCIVKVLRVDGNRLLFLNPTEAKTRYDTALELSRNIGSLVEQVNALHGLSAVYSAQGDLSNAQSSLQQVLDICPETGREACFTAARMALADVLIEKGELETARKMLTDALSTARLESLPESVGNALSRLARISDLRGDFPAAASLYSQAFEVQNKVGNPINKDETLIGWGDDLFFQGDNAGARQKYELVSADSPQKQFSLARLALGSGDSAKCESLARRASIGFRNRMRPDDEAMATVLLGLALVGEGKRSEAVETIAPARTAAQKSQRPLARLTVSIGTARLEGLESRIPAMFHEAEKFGYTPRAVDLIARR